MVEPRISDILSFRREEESHQILRPCCMTIYTQKTVKHTFSGKRVKRGLYESKEGIKVNSDSNGAWNIGRKSKHEGFA